MTTTVLHVIDTLGLGGAERFLVNLVRHLDASKYRPIVAWLSEGGPFAEDLERAGIEVIGIRARGHRDARALSRLVRIMREKRVGIVNTHLFVDSFYGRLAALVAGVPVRIVTQQNAYEDPRLRLPAWQIWANRLLVPVTHHFVAVSQAARTYLQQVERVPASKISVIPNAIEPPPAVSDAVVQTLRIQWADDEGRGPLVGTIARLEPQKGLDTLLQALSELRRQIPNVRCIIVGEGRLRADLESLARSLEVADIVRFVGTRRDVPAILAALDVFVLPSRFEGLSLALLEAMAVGCPVVATSVSGSVEVVKDGETGLLVPPEEPGALSAAIHRLLKDRRLARDVANRARQHVLAHYTIDAVARQYEAIYASHTIPARHTTGEHHT